MSNPTFPNLIDISGEWSFTYLPHPQNDASPELLPDSSAACRMPLPGFWDDHIDRLREAGQASRLRFNPDHKPIQFPMVGTAPDASLPHLVGVGQYDRWFEAPQTGRLALQFGPTFLESWVWINGQRIAHQTHYSTTKTIPLDQHLKPGEMNRLTIQVSNCQPRTMGCITRGFKGYSAGVAGPATLQCTGPARIHDCYLQPLDHLGTLRWHVTIDRPGNADNLQLHWRLVNPQTGSIHAQGTKPLAPGENTWESHAPNLKPWSDRNPNLYRLELTLHEAGTLSDQRVQSFGLRRIETQGFKLQLNTAPLYLRGATEHAYFPQTCTMPLDKATYRANIKKLKALGFNWLRFHTWTPPEPYLDAADEMGMLIQVEPPAGASNEEWEDILLTCRRHPSVVIYCGGNEELLDEAKLDQLEHWANRCHTLVPDALFSPQEALRGIEYCWQKSDLGEDVVPQPYPHNPRRLERVKQFSDCFGQFSWGMLSYRSTDADPALIDQRLEPYQRPCLSHEICIHGNYIDLSLEHRYQGTRIGPELYAAVRRHLRDHGMEHRAPQFHRNASAWMHRLRKHAVENARQCQRIAGYDLLGAIDYHWHRTVYPCGIMNEFYEMKPGETEADVRRYNAPNVLLLDHADRWTCTAGQNWTATLAASIFETNTEADINQPARLTWRLRTQQGHLHARGEWQVTNLALGQVCKLGQIQITTPNLAQPAALTLEVTLENQTLYVQNQWPLWVYPQVTPLSPSISLDLDPSLHDDWKHLLPAESASEADAPPLHIVSELTPDRIDALANGASVLLLGPHPFPSAATIFQISVAGRAEGNLATCIHDHPITRRLPHDGFCDWDFRRMIDEGFAIQLDKFPSQVDPIIEVVSSYKNVRKQAALFETRVGKGKLLACSLKISPDDPAAVYFLQSCIDYARSESFTPSATLTPENLLDWAEQATTDTSALTTDEGFDVRAQMKAW